MQLGKAYIGPNLDYKLLTSSNGFVTQIDKP